MDDKPNKKALDAAMGLSSFDRLNSAMASIAESQNQFKHLGESYSKAFQAYNHNFTNIAASFPKLDHRFNDLKSHSPFSGLQESFKHLNSIMGRDILNNSFATLYDVSRFKSLYESQNNLASKFATMDFATRALANFDVPKLISDIQIKDIIKHVSINQDTIDNLRKLEKTIDAGHALELAKQFGNEFYDSMEKAEHSATESLKNSPDNIDEIIAQAVDKITQQVILSLDSKQPLEKRHKLDLAYRVIWEIVIGIIIAYALTFLPNPQEDKFKERVIERLNKIDQQLKVHHHDLSDKLFYKVIRPVWMSQEKSFSKKRITYLITGQEVQVLNFAGKWVYIVAYDLRNNTFKEGWVLKKYLSRVTSNKPPSLHHLLETWL